MRIQVLWEGKTKDAHLRALEQDFAARIRRMTSFEVAELAPQKPGKQRGDAHRSAKHGKSGNGLTRGEQALLERLDGSVRVFLDPRGREWTSEEFAQWLGGQMTMGRREIAFLIGGPDGFSAPLRKQADVLLALSRMTLTHEWARALLLEQIYRSLTMLRGYPYAR